MIGLSNEKMQELVEAAAAAFYLIVEKTEGPNDGIMALTMAMAKVMVEIGMPAEDRAEGARKIAAFLEEYANGLASGAHQTSH
jgi:predicted secreted protein